MGLEVQFLRHGSTHIACTVPEGIGPTLLWVSDWFIPIEAIDQLPESREIFRRLGRVCRWSMYDPPGTGSSDSISLDPAPDLDYWVDVVESVLDGLGWGPTILCTLTLMGPVGLTFAARNPERVSALILTNPTVGNDADATSRDVFVDALASVYATPQGVATFFPGLGGDPEFQRRWTRVQRHALRPTAMRSIFRKALDFDARELVPKIDCPALLITTEAAVDPEQCAFVAENLPHSRWVQLPTRDTFPITPEDVERWTTTIEEFLTGDAAPVQLDRVLTTVLFTDIVSSTARTVETGDSRWRAILDRHDQVTRDTIRRFGGRLIRSTGDGVLAVVGSTSKAVRCAQALRAGLRELGLEVRAGLHTGEVELRGEDVGGAAVNIARRVCDSAGADEIRVSESVVLVVTGSGLRFDDVGPHELRGVPGTWNLFLARD